MISFSTIILSFKSCGHPANILINLSALKLQRFTSFNDEQQENILFISITLSEVKLERFNFLNEEHKLNILCISVTLAVLKLETFTLLEG